MDFDIVVFDEASQITESCASIPLLKGIKRAMMVGDQFVHYSALVLKKKRNSPCCINLEYRAASAISWPTVKNIAKVVRFDVSFLERLYSQPDIPDGMVKTMLNVQYRSPEELNAFPSKEFYKGRLKTSDANSTVFERAQGVLISLAQP